MEGFLPSCTWGTWGTWDGEDLGIHKENPTNIDKSYSNRGRRDLSKLTASQNEEKWFEVLLRRSFKKFCIEYSSCCISKVKWDQLVAGVDPSYGGLSDLRLIRKRQQVESMAAALSRIIRYIRFLTLLSFLTSYNNV